MNHDRKRFVPDLPQMAAANGITAQTYRGKKPRLIELEGPRGVNDPTRDSLSLAVHKGAGFIVYFIVHAIFLVALK